MIQIRVRIARRSGIEVPACAGEVRRFATADCMNMHAVHSRRHTLQVEDNLNQTAVGDLIFIELDGA